MIEGHGDDIYKYGDKIMHNFSTNIYQLADHTALSEFIAKKTTAITSYPEPAPLSVEKKIAEIEGISPDNIIVTNGATDAIYMIARLHENRKSAVLYPTFSEYADACALNNHTLSYFSSLSEITPDVSIVWICNPNNPTGKVIDKSELQHFIAAHPDMLFIIDQAYHTYTNLPLFSAKEATNIANIILLFSLTKDFCIPGLRIGYAVGDKDLMAKLKNLRTPWSVNHIAIDAANYLLDNRESYKVDLPTILNESKRVREEIMKLGIDVMPSSTNYMLCRLNNGTAAELKEYLVDNYGILIRDASNFHSLSKKDFRIAVQSAAENDLLINALSVYISAR